MQALKTIPRGFVLASASGAATGLVLARRVIAARRAEEARFGAGAPYSLSGSFLQAPRMTAAAAGGGSGASRGKGGVSRERV